MYVNDRYDHAVGEVRNGYVYNSSDKYVGKVSVKGKVEDSNGKYAGTVYHDGSISGSISGGYIYAEGSVNDRNDRPAGKVSGIGTFSNAQDRYFAGGAALLLLLQPTADRASTPITRSSAKKEVYLTRGGRIVWKYTVRTDSEIEDAEEEIKRLKEWAIIHGIGVVYPRMYWEIFVDGVSQDTVFSEKAADEELREYLSGEHTNSQDSNENKTFTPPKKPPTKGSNRKVGITGGIVTGHISRRKALIIFAVLVIVVGAPLLVIRINSSHHVVFSSVFSVSWSPDGKYIALGSYEHSVKVLDAATGKIKMTYTDDVSSLSWSPDDKYIASNDVSSIQVRDAATGEKKFNSTDTKGFILSVAWSPDGKYIASGSDDSTVQVWDALTGRNKLTYTGHSGTVNSVSWSPDGKYIASGSDDGTIQVWNASTGKKVLTYTGHVDWVISLAWSPDGKYIASGSDDGTIQVWNAADGSNVFTYGGGLFWFLFHGFYRHTD